MNRDMIFFTHFRSLGEKSKSNFVCFLAQMRTRTSTLKFTDISYVLQLFSTSKRCVNQIQDVPLDMNYKIFTSVKTNITSLARMSKKNLVGPCLFFLCVGVWEGGGALSSLLNFQKINASAKKGGDNSPRPIKFLSCSLSAPKYLVIQLLNKQINK